MTRFKTMAGFYNQTDKGRARRDLAAKKYIKRSGMMKGERNIPKRR